MPVDLNSYQPPGVYVSDVSQDMVTPLSPGLPDNLLCIVGPALGYQSAVENIAIVSTSGTALSNPGVVQDTSLVVTTMSGSPLVKDTDYTVSTATVAGNVVTSITRLPATVGTVSPGGVANGDTVKVSYHYTSSDYYEPRLFSDYNSLSAVYGPALSNVVGAADPVASPLSLGAKVAFENGAGAILAVAVEHGAGTWRDDFKATYDKLVTDYRVSVLVPIFVNTEADTGTELNNYITDLRLHVDAAAANGYGRQVLVSGSAAFDEVSTPFEDVAIAASNKRIVAVYPTRYNIYSPEINQTVEIGGQYACAALGGRLVLNNVEQALTRQQVLSFTSIPATVTRKMTTAFKNNLAANGVLVIEPDRTDRLRVRHGLTTDVTALTTREISLVRIADVLLQNISVGMDNAGLIGQPIDADMTTRVKGAILGILEQEVANGVIDAYGSVFVRQQPTPDPSIIEVQFAYRPAVPLNYIQVSFSLNMNTGVVTDGTDTQQTT